MIPIPTIPPGSSTLASLHAQAREIFTCALQASSIPAAFDRSFQFENGQMVRQPAAGRSVSLTLDRYEKIYAVALGKAALAMLDTLLERMPPQIAVRGICCAPSLPSQRHRDIRYYAGGHPFPNLDSFLSARAALRLLRQADARTLIFFLISGGGSSLFEAPLDRRIPLEDTIAFHRVLVGSGATIAEINTVRKHFSAVKGGRLAATAPEAAKFSLLVSDVPNRHLDALASGPTLPDRSTIEECREVIERYRLLDRFPPLVQAFFTSPRLPETPGEKRTRPVAGGNSLSDQEEQAALDNIFFAATGLGVAEMPGFAHSQMDVLLSNHDLVSAARDRATAQGWKVVVDNTCDDWDYRDAAHYLLARFHQLRREHPRLCLLSGGEVTVRLEGNPGAGGRNQQFALACALELAGHPVTTPSRGNQSLVAEPGASIVILSAGSDGVDGLSPAAGAAADRTTVARAHALGFDSAAALRGFDSYPLFTALGDTVVTGPTNNNLRDLRILLGC